MSALKRLVHEVHRRSLWQVLGIYLGGSWVALQVVDMVTETAGLPGWTPGMAMVLLLLLLPMVLATAFVQEGMPGARETAVPATEVAPETGSTGETTPDLLHHRVFRWRTVAVGAIGAFTLLGSSIFAYFVMWSSGIGPLGNLQAQGVIEEGALVLLTDFENLTDDPNLGAVLTEALRTDLEQSPAITLLPQGAIEQALVRMGKAPSDPLTPSVARELAAREGIVAVIECGVGSAGGVHALTARVVTTDGATRASFRQTAQSEGQILPSLGKLSRDIRERAGESIRSINGTPALAEVTTPSLDALRKYTEADQLAYVGEAARALSLMEEAVALDTAFAMAYRKLASWYSNDGQRDKAKAAAGEAYRFSRRLSRIERDLATATYQYQVEADTPAAVLTYRNILGYAPRNDIALGNLALLLNSGLRWDETEELLRDRLDGVTSPTVYSHLFRAQLFLGHYADAGTTLEKQVKSGAAAIFALSPRARLAARTGAVEEAHAWADSLEANGSPIGADYYRWAADYRVGRLAEAARHMSGRAERQDRNRAVRPANSSRVTYAVTILQSDTASARRLLADLVSVADRAGPDSVHYGNLAWAHWQAGAAEGVGRMAAMAAAHAGESDDLDAHVRYIRLLEAVTGGRYDLAAYDAAEGDCALCQRQERAEMAYGAGRLSEAVSVYEEIFRVPGADDFGDIWAPLYHERVAAIYEEIGNGPKAAEHYLALADMWAGADPGLQPRVQRAREKAERLRASLGETGSD
jgi:tetratricopeptide (TPR) repeat protein